MDKIKSYKDLIVWQKSINLTVEIYKLTKKLLKDELYSLSNQMRRAAVSASSNIAEGQARKYFKEFVNFISIAQGSIAELETQLILCIRLDYLTEENTSYALSILYEVSKMLAALIKKLQTNHLATGH